MSKLYCFCNTYLSDLQKGIQTAHLVNELHNKFYYLYTESLICEQFYRWSHDSKTIIVFDGGNQKDLESFELLFNKSKKYPNGFFREDKESLNYTLTVVGIILPDNFDMDKERLNYICGSKGDTLDIQLAQLLQRSRLV